MSAAESSAYLCCAGLAKAHRDLCEGLWDSAFDFAGSVFTRLIKRLRSDNAPLKASSWRRGKTRCDVEGFLHRGQRTAQAEKRARLPFGKK